MVGADGVRSRMARWLGAETLERSPSRTRTFYTYVAGPRADWRLRVPRRPGRLRRRLPDPRRRGLRLARPADRGAGRPALRRGRRAAALLSALDRRVPALGARVRAGRVDAPVRGAVDLPNHLRRPIGGPGRAGRWSVTPATTATRSPDTASPTPSATPSCWPPPSTSACATPTRRRGAGGVPGRPRRRAARDVRPHPRPDRLSPPDRFVELQIQLSEALEREADHSPPWPHPWTAAAAA